MITYLKQLFSAVLVKEIYKERGIKDCDHDLVKKAWDKEDDKV